VKVREFVAELQKLPQDFEIAILAASAHARPPVLEPVNQWAWMQTTCGLENPAHAYLIRPMKDVIR